jgi:fructokinase
MTKKEEPEVKSMKNLYSIGEVLIDFIPLQKGRPLKDVVEFERAPGGAPANVAAAVAKYGGKSSMITKLGMDAFGDFLLEQLQQAGVCTDKIKRTNEANTGLAFVSLRSDGERDFSFYRNPSADLLLSETEIEENWFDEGDILHFCSVDLVESPMKQAHVKAIHSAKEKGSIISFDPNVRLPLWSKPEDCRKTILEFAPLCHILKISDEELEFITGISTKIAAIESLLLGDVKAIIYTKGAHGAELFLKNGTYQSGGYLVDVQDTTGAGDAFMGGFLYKLLENNVRQQNLEVVLETHHEDILSFANASGALTATGKGAISSLPTTDEISCLIQNQEIKGESL